MPEKFNAARRVKNILERTRGIPDSEATMDVWANALRVTAELDEEWADHFETIRLLGLLRQQVKHVEAEVQAFGLSPESYGITFQKLDTVIVVHNLSAQWGTYGAHITDEVLRQLDIFSQLSSIDEPVVPNPDLGELNNDLLEFRSDIVGSEVDDRLKAFVLTQIDTIRRGIRDYPIRGEEAIKVGDAAVFATAASERDLIREHQDEEVMRKTGGFWDRFRKLKPSVVINLDPARMLTDVDPQKVLEAGSDIIDKLQ